MKDLRRVVTLHEYYGDDTYGYEFPPSQFTNINYGAYHTVNNSVYVAVGGSTSETMTVLADEINGFPIKHHHPDEIGGVRRPVNIAGNSIIRIDIDCLEFENATVYIGTRGGYHGPHEEAEDPELRVQSVEE